VVAVADASEDTAWEISARGFRGAFIISGLAAVANGEKRFMLAEIGA
jgi:hypothetical protein